MINKFFLPNCHPDCVHFNYGAHCRVNYLFYRDAIEKKLNCLIAAIKDWHASHFDVAAINYV